MKKIQISSLSELRGGLGKLIINKRESSDFSRTSLLIFIAVSILLTLLSSLLQSINEIIENNKVIHNCVHNYKIKFHDFP